MMVVGVSSLILFLCAVAWVVVWFLPRTVSKGPSGKIPATVPPEWVEEYRQGR